MSNSPATRRSGFTLIEILLVITIIGILAAIFVGLAGTSQDKQFVAKAKGEMSTIALGLQTFKTRYDDYPWLGADDSGNPSKNARDLYRVLRGELIMQQDGSGNWRMVELNSTPRPLVDLGQLTVEDPDGTINSGDEYLVDPWDKPYRYFYRSEGSGTRYRASAIAGSDWVRSGFLLLSAGPDGEYSTNAVSRGSLPTNAEDYFQGGADTDEDNLIYGYEY